MRPFYRNLLKVSAERADKHKERMDAFKAEHGPGVRLPLDNCCEEQTNMCKILRQIKKDVPRTTSTFNQEIFNESMQSGNNPIYNLLAAYAELDEELGYTQGMNFLVAMVYVAVRDEEIAFCVFRRIMQSKQQAKQIQMDLAPALRDSQALKNLPEWRFLYTDGMKKLGAFVADINEWLIETKRMLYIHFESRKILLEVCLSNPFLSLFSNIIPNQQALKVMDRFIHFGQKALVQIVKNILTTQQDKLLRITDQFELQQYLARQMFMDAITEGNFFPTMPEQSAIMYTAASPASYEPHKKTLNFTRRKTDGKIETIMMKTIGVSSKTDQIAANRQTFGLSASHH